MVSLVWCNSTQEKEKQLPRQKSQGVTELNHRLTYWSRFYHTKRPISQGHSHGLSVASSSHPPIFFFFSLRQMFAVFCSAGSGTQDFEWNPGLWACQVGTLPLGCIHPQLFSYLSCEHQKWLNTCDQSSKGGAESRGWLGLEVNNSMRSLSIRGAFPMGPWESSHFSLTPGSRPHQRAYAGGSVSWLRWSGGAWHGLTA